MEDDRGDTLNASLTIQIKPTIACNLSCGYCYNSKIKDNSKMSLDTVKTILTKLPNEKHVSITWHGGEPLLMGTQFYKDIFSIQNDLGLNVTNNIQSNITLLNSDWVSLFRLNNIGVGVSLDGVADVHNLYRNNSFESVIGNIKALQQNNIKIGLISTITQDSLSYLYESFKLFNDLRINLRLNPMIIDNVRTTRISSKAYGFAVRFFFDMWLGTSQEYSIYPISNILGYLENNISRGCLFGNNCIGLSNAVFPNGDVYVCGRVAKRTGYVGNVLDSDFSFGLDNPRIQELRDKNEDRIQRCKDCNYFGLCRNGCMNNSNPETGIDAFCDAYKSIINHVIVRHKQMGG